jgi:DeoR/GlpR family transcriptional regulator of sugar metabolism
LTVITHSLDVFRILCDCEGFSLILCGGHYLREEHAFFGALTLDMLKNLHMQKAFVFPSALSLEYGICDYQEDLYPIQKQLIQSSDDIFVLADSSKFEKKALLKVEEMKKTYTYVTDSDLPEELLQLYRENDRIIYKGENSA